MTLLICMNNFPLKNKENLDNGIDKINRKLLIKLELIYFFLNQCH